MFATTFLGHQGWMFRSEHAAVLVDPLLCEEFGAAHVLGYRVYPPRIWHREHMPAIDAVVLTHEHDDHFDIPSLATLDRKIPIYLSARSSSAAHGILAEMGFTVHPLTPGEPVTFGELEITPFAGNHMETNTGDEWDTLPFLVRHTGGAGSFFSMVDIPITPGHIEWAKARVARPGIIGWTNNTMDWSHTGDYMADREQATQQTFMKMGMGHKLILTAWGTPAAMVMCAGGFAFEGDRTWLNRRVFCVDNDAVVASMANVYKKEKFFVGVPGHTFVMEGNKLTTAERNQPWLGTAPEEAWPSRAKSIEKSVPDYAPATGRRALSEAERAELPRVLDELAGSLVGGGLFRSMHSLLVTELGGRRPTIALELRVGDADAREVYEYVPAECRFVAVAGSAPETVYLGGLQCWATDLVAVLRGELGPIALTYGRARFWNAAPKRFMFGIIGELDRLAHPLRRPAAYLRTYQRLLRGAGDHAPSVHARAGS